ncbi:P22 phage major capsid protein family protein [Bosea sp. AS-1]|uniref:P22 phage major capsid protein family protein n=1 Tax=Bosea sp. AS-1 TaxID=2015316 RepID=UPI0012FD9614|nr:P22 phage major capsid protein family protein [Bosea sp. AS-1]
MANTLTALAPTLFSAAKQVAAEPFGVISALDARFDDKRVAKGDTVLVPVAPTRAASDFVPGNVAAAGTDATASSIGVQITKSRKVSWNLTGEQQRSLENATIDNDWVSQLVKQGMRTLRNECEIDAATALKVGASRAFGTAGTTPFASDLSPLTNARKILQDNGAPLADLQFVGDTSAGLNLRNLSVIQQAYAAGSDEERRSGLFQRQFGFVLTESAGIGVHTKGTGASYTTDTAGYAVGSTVINVITGSGTILAGDVISIAGDTNKYVVTGALSGGAITIGAPGLRVAIPASATNVTVGNNYTANLAFERTACVGIMRPPLIPENPTISQMAISDPMGMTYLMLDIAQYGQRSWELHLAWGFKTVNGEFSALVLG